LKINIGHYNLKNKLKTPKTTVLKDNSTVKCCAFSKNLIIVNAETKFLPYEFQCFDLKTETELIEESSKSYRRLALPRWISMFRFLRRFGHPWHLPKVDHKLNGNSFQSLFIFISSRPFRDSFLVTSDLLWNSELFSQFRFSIFDFRFSMFFWFPKFRNRMIWKSNPA
jgi:hypothetical protein